MRVAYLTPEVVSLLVQHFGGKEEKLSPFRSDWVLPFGAEILFEGYEEHLEEEGEGDSWEIKEYYESLDGVRLPDGRLVTVRSYLRKGMQRPQYEVFINGERLY